MLKREYEYLFEGWFTICIPKSWENDIDDELLTIIKTENPKGVLQISFANRTETNRRIFDVAEIELTSFINQFDIEIEINTFKIIDTPIYAIGNVRGRDGDDFIEVWTIVNENKVLLVTYISPKKSREVSVAEDIVHSISFV